MKQKVDMYIQLADAVPYADNYLDPNKVYHWRIYIGKTLSDYWVVCGKTWEQAIKRFLSFGNYEYDNLYLIY